MATAQVKLLPLLKETASEWSKHNASTFGAALAYYSVFSIGPILLIAMAIAGLMFDQQTVQGGVHEQLRAILGPHAAIAIDGLLQSVSRPGSGLIATAVSVVTLLFAATAIFVQLKDALNTMWEVEPPKVGGIWGFVRTYIIAIVAVLSIGVVVLLTLVTTTVVAAVSKYVTQFLPLPEWMLQLANFVVAFGIMTLVFAVMYKWLPDTHIAWSDVWIGAAVTALLFDIGKALVGLYLGKLAIESSYGAAGSIVALMLWMYYSAQIVFFGAEFTQVYARHHGSRADRAAAPAPTAAAPSEPRAPLTTPARPRLGRERPTPT
jgi:membrane protein